MKKILKLLILFFCLLISSYFFNVNVDSFEKLILPIDTNQDYSLNSISILLSSNIDSLYKEYSIEDFENLHPDSIEELDYERSKLLRDKIDGKEVPKEINKLSPNTYHRDFVLKWNENKSKEEIINYIHILEQRSDVYCASPDYFYEFQSSFYPNDYSNAAYNNSIYYNKLCLPDVWKYSLGNYLTKVGIIDTGIQGNHPDLSPQLNSNLHKDFYNTTNPTPLIDYRGHGTKVAGVLGAKGNNNIGITGICMNVSLISLKVSDSDLSNSSLVRQAIYYSINNDIPILNFSSATTIYDSLMYYAISNYDGLFVCAAGNDSKKGDRENNRYVYYPADFCNTLDNVVSVGCLKSNSNNIELDIDSNFGTNCCIYTTVFGYSCDKNLSYSSFGQTSSASPVIAGLGALILSINNNLTGSDLKNIIMNNSDIKTIYEPITEQNIECFSGPVVNFVETIKYVIRNTNFDNFILDNNMGELSENLSLSINDGFVYYSIENLDEYIYQFEIKSLGYHNERIFDSALNELEFNNLDDIGNTRFRLNLDTGLYYLKIENKNNININVKIKTTNDYILEINEEDTLNKNLIENSNIKFNIIDGGFYKITFNAFSLNNYNVELPDYCLKIYSDDERNSIVNKTLCNDCLFEAKTLNGIDHISCYFESNVTYYVDIETNISDLYYFIIKIEPVPSTTITDNSFSEFYLFNNSSVEYDMIFNLNLNQSSNLIISNSYLSSYNTNSLNVLILKNINDNNSELNVLIDNYILSNNQNYDCIYNLSPGKYYFAILNQQTSGILSIEVNNYGGQ